MPGYCGPSNAVPSCSAIPSVGFGSSHFGSGFGLGGSGFGSLGSGGSVSATSLGVLQGVQPQCINQLPPNEVVIQPPPVAVTVPGAIMSATPVPVQVGGVAPCAISGSGSTLGFGLNNLGLGSSGFGSSGLLGSHDSFGFNNRGLLGHRGSLSLNPTFGVCH
ncbi:hypothetical protein JRQ81_009269 [Phrynocephalus forsythii]|uniref:Uncharacterized protein n=1 Tax=Phrynocephalus forsythii TaxID=171643 RepID=A0A9Q0XAG3_9SAUR|nr:hypothetical protein JRQ81_009269 [Phrynocephalus forsythii]